MDVHEYLAVTQHLFSLTQTGGRGLRVLPLFRCKEG